MKKISILGSTGSIGTQTLDIAREHKEDFEIFEVKNSLNNPLKSSKLDKLISISFKILDLGNLFFKSEVIIS